MARKQSFNYFDAFVDIAEFACQSSLLVDSVLNNFHADELDYYKDTIHKFEHEADERNHAIMNALAKEFIPPLEIEDISDMANMLDTVVDDIEDIIIKLYAYSVTRIPQCAIEFSKIILPCCQKLKEAVQELPNYKKSPSLNGYIVEVNNFESEADELYISSMHKLHQQTDIREVMVWSRMLDGFEKVCDTCEDAANLIHNIVMKNT
ncbi:MAG: DUF47 family protein [Oscillospiraceae bacterium]|jgi:uncharacterized protein Yka (UPF0111/DUF47 family)|nr:DUF47 family protein [Oscillospiraceae bacterium]